MNYTKKTDRIKSADGHSEFYCYTYTPKKEPKAVIQYVHGMKDYAERNEYFFEYLCSEGFAVIAHDCLGHGRLAAENDSLGYFARENGWIYLLKDTRKVAVKAKKEFGNIPHFMIGSSMGSFIIRAYLAKFSFETAGAVLLATTKPKIFTDALWQLSKVQSELHGVKSRWSVMDDKLKKLFNSRIDDVQSSADWMTRDIILAERMEKDKLMNFSLTVSGYRDMFTLIEYANDNSWYKKVWCDIPVLLMDGTDNPTGRCGRDSLSLYRKMKANGLSDVDVKLYDGYRHNLTDELGCDDVFADITEWINSRLGRKAEGDK